MRKLNFFKTLLVAVGLCAGVNAWADGNKRVLNAQNYETAIAADWTSPNGTVSFKTSDKTYGNYTQIDVSGSGNRSCYKSVTFGNEAGTGYTTADMITAGYVIEFDMLMSGGNVNARSEAQFIIPTTGPNLATNTTYTGTDYIFALSQPTNTTGSRDINWYVNDLTNGTATTASLSYDSWYHYKFVVTATSVEYTISHGATTDATGSKTVTALPTIKGFFGLLGRGSGCIKFDNLEIYDYTAALTVTEPTFTFKAVNGANRIYTLANPDGIGKLYYTTAPAESAPAVGNAAYTSSDKTNLDVTFSTSGKYYAYVLHTNGTTVSTITSLNVTAGEITLATPVFTVVDMVQAADGFYYPQVTFSSNNSSLEGTPTATFDETSPYTFTATGSITVTASADGYTSSSSTFTVTNAYIKSKTIDFGVLTASNFDPTVWTTATGVPRDYWTNRAAAIPADVTFYKLTNTSATQGDPDNSAVLDGITISNYYQRAPEVYVGYGLLTPYTAISGGGNYMNFTVDGATADDYIVYNGWNNYGSGTFNTVQAGDATFGLYRYDTMLRTINVYSPAPATVSTSITAAGYATYVSDYDLDYTSVEGLTAYKATIAGSTITFNKVTTVPAGEGVLLKGAEKSYSVPVTAGVTAWADADNAFVRGTGAAVASEADGKYNYILNNVGGVVGFYKAAGQTVATNRAYIQTPVSTSRLSFVFDDEEEEVTGIKTINVVKNGEAIYNLNGQRVNKAKNGLYILNGRKVMFK